MISKVKLQNYRCFQELDVNLTPLTVLVGPNSAGKSTFLEALTFLAGTTKYQMADTKFWLDRDAMLFRSGFGPSDGEVLMDVAFFTEPDTQCRYSLGFAPGKPHWGSKVRSEAYWGGGLEARRGEDGQIVVSGDREATEAFSRRRNEELLFLEDQRSSRLPECIRPARDFLAGIHAFDFRPERIQDANELPGKGPVPLERDGSNLAAVLHSLRDEAPERFEAIQEELRSFEPACSNILFEQLTGKKQDVEIPLRSLAYRMTIGGNPVTIPACSVSAGLRLFTAYLTLRHLGGKLSVLLVEEPEHGVHPGRLRDIFSCLRSIVKGQGTREPVQVIITTHSPYLLDLCEKEEILVFYREKDGPCRARPFAEVKNVDRLLESFELGELWASTPERDLFEGGSK